ncbi:hypothetical protein KW459_05700 [Vibrio fluvialis]|nr:hypothetical protein [Vibrio fluvialis]MBY7939396.1 hypothetical protein [Vibrio fluvialis]
MKKFATILFSLICLAGFGYLVWIIGGNFFSWIKSLDKEVAAAGVTALIGFIGLLYVQWNSKAKEISDSHRPAKIEVYETFFDIVERFMSGEASEENLDPESKEFPQDLKDQFTKLSRGMIVWASPQVIKAWSEFRERASEPKTPVETLLAVDKVLQAIRADLGNSNFGLKRGDVVKLYISNPSEVDV